MSDSISVGTRVIVIAHADELLLGRSCVVVENDGDGPHGWLNVRTQDTQDVQATGWVRRSQVSRDNAVDRLGDLYLL